MMPDVSRWSRPASSSSVGVSRGRWMSGYPAAIGREGEAPTANGVWPPSVTVPPIDPENTVWSTPAAAYDLRTGD